MINRAFRIVGSGVGVGLGMGLALGITTALRGNLRPLLRGAMKGGRHAFLSNLYTSCKPLFCNSFS